MKKLIFLSILSLLTIYSCKTSSIASSVATVGNEGWKVTLYHYTDGVKFSDNGSSLSVINNAFAGHKKAGYATYGSGLSGSGGSNYYTYGLQLDKNVPTHVITIEKDGKKVTQTFDRKSKAFIDVTAALGETQQESFTDLQNEFVKQHSGKKKKS